VRSQSRSAGESVDAPASRHMLGGCFYLHVLRFPHHKQPDYILVGRLKERGTGLHCKTHLGGLKAAPEAIEVHAAIIKSTPRACGALEEGMVRCCVRRYRGSMSPMGFRWLTASDGG